MANNKKKKKLFKVIILIVVILVIGLVFLGSKKSGIVYEEETAQLRDIIKYHSFTGNVVTYDGTDVTASVSQKVVSLNVKEGDEVKKGDVIAVLDSSSIERNIAIKEANMDSTDISTSYSISTAKKNYEDYLEGIQNGTNSQLNTAQTTLNNALSSLESAEKKYLEAKEELDNSTDSTLISAQESLASAEKTLEQAKQDYEDYLEDVDNEDYYSIRSLKTALETAEENLTKIKDGTYSRELLSAEQKYNIAKVNYQNALNNSETSSTELAALKTAMETALETYEKLDSEILTYSEYKEAYDDALLAYEKAKNDIDSSNDSTLKTLLRTYENAQTSYETAQRNLTETEKSLSKTLETYYDSYESAQTTYNEALQNYETVKVSVNQTLESYKSQYENALATSDNTASELELESYYEQLDECTIYATATGVIESLTLEVGGYTVSNQTVAVITDYSKLKVTIKIDEYDIGNVSIGDTVSVYINALDTTVEGTISSIDRSATSSGGVSYFNADVEIEAGDNIRSGMSVEVKRISVNLKNVVSISMDAISYDDDNSAYVYMYGSDGVTAEKVYLTLGSTDGTYIQVIDGLQKGDIILTEKTGNSLVEMRLNMGG